MAPQLLPDQAIDEALTTLQWQREGDELVKTVTRKDFAAALAYVNEVGALAEARNHHPDISISWNKVTLRLSTHSAGGLTQFGSRYGAGGRPARFPEARFPVDQGSEVLPVTSIHAVALPSYRPRPSR